VGAGIAGVSAGVGTGVSAGVGTDTGVTAGVDTSNGRDVAAEAIEGLCSVTREVVLDEAGRT
jgi:hypothetical protein